MGSDTRLLNTFFLVCWAFNAASLRSMMNGGPGFSGTDPVLGSTALLMLWAPLTATSQSFPKAHGLASFLGACALLSVSIFHIQNRHVYLDNDAYHSTNWQYAAVINAYGALMLFSRALPRQKQIEVTRIVVMILAIAGALGFVAFSAGTTKAADTGPDLPFFPLRSNAYGPTTRALPFQYHSQYVEMSDGVELAVDVYLPNDYQEGDKLPTFLHLTRYHRAEARSWLTKYISLFGHAPNNEGIFPMRSLPYLNTFVPDGYAFVSVDVRGTGASFGTRPLDLIDREVQDYGEIAAWTRNQTFCNGQIGTGGISYDGVAGALMAAQGGIDAVAMLFTPTDIWEDVGFVGGVPTIGFVDWYGKFTKASENNVPVNDVDNELPADFKLISNRGFCGVAPVSGAEHRLDLAVQEHRDNLDMLQVARDPSVRTKDSTLVTTPDGRRHTFQELGITTKVFDKLVENNVSVYSVAGYFDSGSVRSSARLHNYLTLRGADSKLTIGPWTHGARACWSPTKGASATKPQYPLFADVKRYFDCKLKDRCASNDGGLGLADEPALHYFLSGPDEWQNGPDMWPPAGLNERSLPLKSFDAKYSKNAVATSDGKVSFKVDFSTTTGTVSRWNLVHHLMKRAVTYPDREEQAATSLVFHLDMKQGATIIGSPKIGLSMAIQGEAKDAVVFAYLEETDVDTGKTNYITEAVLRVSHRPSVVPSDLRIGSSEAVHRTFLEKDFRPWVPGVFTLVELIMEPVAYVVKPRSNLRLVLAGADIDNFYLDNIEGLATDWDIDTNSSWLMLPVLYN